MNKFLNDLLTFVLFVASIACFYFAVTAAFASALLNFILLFAAIFFLIQAAGFIDKAKGFGKYSNYDSPTVPNKVEESPDKTEDN